MKAMKFGALALAGAFLVTTSASALQTTEIRRGGNVTMERQQELDAKRALRAEIRATHEEYRALRKANDPRADQAGRELEALKSEWTRRYGADSTEMRKRGNGKKLGHDKQAEKQQMKQKRQKHNR